MADDTHRAPGSPHGPLVGGRRAHVGSPALCRRRPTSARSTPGARRPTTAPSPTPGADPGPGGEPPVTPGGVVEVLHGTTVADPFRWLEDGRSDRTRAWTDEQNRVARAALDALPGRDRLHARLVELLSSRTVGAPAVRKDRLFTVDRGGPGPLGDQAGVAGRSVADGPGAPRRVLVEPQALLDDETAALDWYHPSADGERVAFGLSTGGDERSTLRVLEVESGRLLADAIPHTRAASVAWAPKGDAFAYTRYPDPDVVGEEAAQYGRTVFWHGLGTDPAQDRLIWADLPDPTAWADVSCSRNGRWLLVHMAIGWDRVDVHLLDRAVPDA